MDYDRYITSGNPRSYTVLGCCTDPECEAFGLDVEYTAREQYGGREAGECAECSGELADDGSRDYREAQRVLGERA